MTAMTSSTAPSTPAAELAARRAYAGPLLANGVLTPDLVALAQGGVSIVLASVDPAGRPVPAIGLACRVERDGRMRVIVDRAVAAPVLAAVEAGQGVAVTFSRAHDHRSFQVKAQAARVVAAREDDMPEVERQCAILWDELAGIGYDIDLARLYVTHGIGDRASVEFMPESAFVQTPGPGAGSALAP